MENLNDVEEGSYLALPVETMINLMNTMDLCVQALELMDPQDKEQLQIKEDALGSVYALINAHPEFH